MVACSSSLVLLVVTDSETKQLNMKTILKHQFQFFIHKKTAIATTARFIIKSVITVYPLTLKQQA